MASWTIDITLSARKELDKLDTTAQKRITRYLYERVAASPRAYGRALMGDKAGYWRYRVGDYRIVAEILDQIITVKLIRVGHRKDIYDF